MKESTKEIAIANIAQSFVDLRKAENNYREKVIKLSKAIVDNLRKLREAGETREECKGMLHMWNNFTEDGTPIVANRTRQTLDNWLRDAGFESTTKSGEVRKSRSDSGKGKEVKKGKETKEQALARIRTLMAQHGITVADLA
jgi:hypothetical protein